MERKHFRQAAAQVGADLDDLAVDGLLAYADLLLEKAVPLGMISKADADRILERHILDSLRATPVLAERNPSSVVDLGSGAGLPGIPLAIANHDTQFTLAEARSRRAAFLELAVERLVLTNVRVHPDRSESLAPGSFGVATARAFAQPERAWALARPLLRSGGALVLFAGGREPFPEDLPDVAEIRKWGAGPAKSTPKPLEGRVPPRTSRGSALASIGDLVIITTK